MSKRVYLIILKAGIFLSFVSVFLVFKNLLFPYISSKQIFFNILIEILTVFWLVFIVKFPEYRPKKSLISFGLGAYLLVILISSILGVDFNLSFWGDVERMLGFFHIFHFFLFYLIIITVFRSWKDWKILLIASVICAFFVSFKVLLGDKAGTIGNTAYVAGYLIFNIYFSFLLFAKEKNQLLRWVYIAPFLIMLAAFLKADSSGALVGLGSSILLLFFLLGILHKNKKLKIITLAFFVIALILVSFLFLMRNSAPFKDYSWMKPIKEISIQKNTFQTRLISWRAAFLGVPDNPFFGTGYGNFAIVFDKYFDANFYTHTSSETFFDRAHNNLIDILATTGIFGLLAYLIFILAAFYYLASNFKKKKIELYEFAIVFCLLVAYLIQNLAVFDSLVTYISLMVLLAYIYWLENKDEPSMEEKKENKKFEFSTNKELLLLIILGIFSISIIYQYNFKVYKMLDGTIKSISLLSANQLKLGYGFFRDTMEKYDTPLNRDSRFVFNKTFLSSLPRNQEELQKLSNEERAEIIEFILDSAKKNLELSPNDTIANLQMSQVYNTAAFLIQNDNIEKANNYLMKAFEYVDKAIELSPERLTTYYAKSEMLLNIGKTKEAIDLLELGFALNNEYYATHCNLAPIYIMTGDEERGYELMDYCIDQGGLKMINSDVFLQKLLGHYATSSISEISSENFPRVIKIYQQIVKSNPKDAQNWIDLAKLFENNGQYEKAIESARKAAELDQSLSGAVEDYARSLMAK